MTVTPHFSDTEFSCRDGTRYPREWIVPRLLPLCEVLEIVRSELGTLFGDVRLVIDSGYRTRAYNAGLAGAATNSQHCEGRAADIRALVLRAEALQPLAPSLVHDTVLRLHQAGRLRLGGLGRYPDFTHCDTREGTRLAQWTGSRVRN